MDWPTELSGLIGEEWPSYWKQVIHGVYEMDSIVAYDTHKATVGGCMFTFEHGVIYISFLLIKSTARNQGVGSAILSECKLFAYENNACQIELHCSAKREDLKRFYERNNFKCTDTIPGFYALDDVDGDVACLYQFDMTAIADVTKEPGTGMLTNIYLTRNGPLQEPDDIEDTQ